MSEPVGADHAAQKDMQGEQYIARGDRPSRAPNRVIKVSGHLRRRTLPTFGYRLRLTALLGVTIVGGGLLAGVTASKAKAFDEDVCYSNAGKPVANCATLPPICPLKNATLPCRAEVLARFAVQTVFAKTGRSLVHADSTYIMAMAVGFSQDDAYWIAAYDQAMDFGTFTPRNTDGTEVSNADALTTSDIGGLERMSFSTGGLLFHFGATMKDQSGYNPDGLHPNVADASHEVMIAHLRRWAFAGPGSSVPLCTGGFTVASADGDFATGTSCYGGAKPVPIRGLLSLVAPTAIPFATTTGLQVISGDVRSDQFDSWTGGGSRAAAARIGIYLHTLADRVSHHRCTDAAEIEPPSKLHNGFREELNNSECNQGLHALRHLYERGVPFDQLEPADRTMEAALPLIYDELVTFAQAQDTVNAQAATPLTKQAVINRGLLPALQISGAIERMTAVTNVGCRLDIPPFPGAPACPGTN